jgi:transposase InsO family protein
MIAQYRPEYPLHLMCRVLDMSPAGFYAWRDRPPSAHQGEDTRLRVTIAALHRQSHQTYGSPRILRDLRAAGERVAQKRVARLLREQGLVGTPPRRFQVTTDSRHAHPIAPNHLARQFQVAPPNRVWATDVTYVATWAGWLYLAVVLDLGSRRVVGWALSPRLDRHLVLTALDRALARRRPPPGLLHHSDRGSVYASADYQVRLQAAGCRPSMSRRGDCWDNAVVESFFATLKRELLARHRWPTREGATHAIAEYIEGWYNVRRRHSSLGYLSPAAYEARLPSAA